MGRHLASEHLAADHGIEVPRETLRALDARCEPVDPPPQAKGHVERHHSTHQDHRIKKMRLAGIGDYEAANRYLDEECLTEHNAKFACEPVARADFHECLPKCLDLNWVFCLEHERVVSNDWVVRFQNRFLQLQPTRRQAVAPGMRVTVEQARDGVPRVMCADP